MPIVNWSNEYSINVDEIDNQHQEMLGLVNNLHSSVESRTDKNILKKMLAELVVYTRMHFATEEQLMEQHDYPHHIEHKNEHRLLLQHLEFLLSAVSIGKYPTFFSDYDISTDWMFMHISGCDKKLGEFLNSQNVY
jgi:hemerythrin-like metal-binding protein